MVDSQKGLTGTLRFQAATFKDVHSRFAGLIEDEQMGGQMTQTVRKILKLDIPSPLPPLNSPAIPSTRALPTGGNVIGLKMAEPRTASAAPLTASLPHSAS